MLFCFPVFLFYINHIIIEVRNWGIYMGQKINDKSAFTLIELIVVIAILGILALLLVPSFIGYATDAQKAVCQANMQNIVREYEISAAHNSPKTIDEAKNLLNEIYVTHHADNTTSSSFYTGGMYSGICGNGGNYGNMISKDFMILTINCSEHGDGIIDIIELERKLSSISFSNISGFPYQNLAAYFNPSRTSLDSEATNVDTRYEPYSSFAQAIDVKLKEQGIDTTGRSWRMFKSGNTYNLFLTDEKITMNNITAGDTINCTKYDIAQGKVIYGKVSVIKSPNGNYPIIDGSSFVEHK